MKLEAPRRVAAIARKEFRHLRRDYLTGGMVVGIPLMMTLLFGYAINQDVRNLRAASLDLAGTSRSRALLADAEASQVIKLVERAASERELQRMLVDGTVSVGILVPHDFESRAVRGERPAAHLLVDGGDPIILGAVRGLAALPVSHRPAAARVRPPPTFEVRPYYNPERRSSVFIVPGICGMILTVTMVLFTSTSIVRERERGNLELLITTPVRPVELMLGKIAPYLVIGYIQVTLILALGWLLFDLPMRGSLVDVYLGVGVFVAATLTLGLMISTVAQTQFQAFQMSFVSFLPQLLLSGFMFPYDGMPRPAQWLAEIFPLTHFLRIIRGIVLRGATLADVWSDVWQLGLFFLVGMTLAVLRFRKRLD